MSAIKNLTPQHLAAYFDHTQLRASANEADFIRLCDESRVYGFAMVAINPAPVALCKRLLAGTDVHVGAAVGFPLGQNTWPVKRGETIDAIDNGADEIDYVVNLGWVKDKHFDLLEKEMEEIVSYCRAHGVLSKVIFETCYLGETEIIDLCKIANAVKPDFVKTSTGFGTEGATLDNVRLMRHHADPGIRIKAAGGIRTLESALAMIDAGAARIGSTACVTIVEELRRQQR